MANSYYRLSDGDFSSFVFNFDQVADSEGASYGWDAIDQGVITGATAAYINALNALSAAETAYRAAVQTKEDARAAAEDMVTRFGQPLYFNPDITDAQIAKLGLEPREGSRVPVQPAQPLSFSAEAFGDGRVSFKWNRNGNPYSVSFQIEQAPIGGGQWEMVTVTTKSKATVSGFTPGVGTQFRVVAFKGGEMSVYSNVSTIYGNGNTGILKAA